MNIELLLVICVSIFIGMLIEYKVKLYNKVEAKDYDILLNKYASLKTKLNEKVYIGATYTNGYEDVIVYSYSSDFVWFIMKDSLFNLLSLEEFNAQFKLKDLEA